MLLLDPFRHTASHSMSYSMQCLISLTEPENSLLRQESLSLFSNEEGCSGEGEVAATGTKTGVQTRAMGVRSLSCF